MSAQIVTWDWKAQPEMEVIAAAVQEISDGRVFMREYDTGGDNYAWIVSDHEVSDEEAERLYPVMSEEVEVELDDDLLEKTRWLAKDGGTVEQVIRDAIMAGTEREDDDSSEEGTTEGQPVRSRETHRS